MSRDVISCHVNAICCELQPCLSSNATKLRAFAFYSHSQVTSGQSTSLKGDSSHVRSRDVISCHVNATSCELQPCKISIVPKTQVFVLLQPLPGDIRSNDVTFGHLRSHDVISCHVNASCKLQPCRSSNVPKTQLFNVPSTATSSGVLVK